MSARIWRRGCYFNDIYLHYKLYLYKRSKFKIEKKKKLHCHLNNYKGSCGLSMSVPGAVAICKHTSSPQELFSCEVSKATQLLPVRQSDSCCSYCCGHVLPGGWSGRVWRLLVCFFLSGFSTYTVLPVISTLVTVSKCWSTGGKELQFCLRTWLVCSCTTKEVGSCT